MAEKSDITGYHAHIYYSNPEARERAAVLREHIDDKFVIRMGRWRETPVGPHPQPMYQVAFEVDQFSDIVPWLMVNRNGLTILVHPETTDNFADHVYNSVWFGEVLPVNEDFLRSGQTSA
ncbi:MAG: DOPA 4,5-dioxygenase family protein [Rhodospirillales bacterium]|jgi:aromatic ring-cleaving dioxygenase